MKKMKVVCKIWLDRGGKAFGDGPCELLKRVEQTRSLHRSAGPRGMASSKAWRLIRILEQRLGFDLLERKVGGSSGGESKVTPEGKALMKRYEQFRNESRKVLDKTYQKYFGFFLIVFSLVLIHVQGAIASDKKLLIFAGAASKPALEEIKERFQKEVNIPLEIVFGGSGYVLSQMKLSQRGDLYFPGSSDFMELAKREGCVFPDTERVMAYLLPAINVQRANPRGIASLKDLTQTGIRLAIGNPERVCVGTYAVEVIEKNLTPSEKKQFRRNLVTYAESCEKTANMIALKAVDGVLGWSVFQNWNPDRIATVYLKPDEVPRIGYLPIAVSTFTNDRRSAQRLIDFLESPQGKMIFRKHGYFTEPQEARRFTLPATPVGGEYVLPARWRRNRLEGATR